MRRLKLVRGLCSRREELRKPGGDSKKTKEEPQKRKN